MHHVLAIITTQKSKEQIFSLINLCVPRSMKYFMIMGCSVCEEKYPISTKKKSCFSFKHLGRFKVWIEVTLSHDQVYI